VRYKKPLQPKEALVVFELCFALRNNNIQFDLEYSDRVIDWNIGNHKVRFDIVIIDHRSDIIAIIECKRQPMLIKNNNQLAKYNTFGVPVLLCRGMGDIPNTVAKVRSLLVSTQ
jgi:hypothetical protein